MKSIFLVHDISFLDMIISKGVINIEKFLNRGFNNGSMRSNREVEDPISFCSNHPKCFFPAFSFTILPHFLVNRSLTVSSTFVPIYPKIFSMCGQCLCHLPIHLGDSHSSSIWPCIGEVQYLVGFCIPLLFLPHTCFLFHQQVLAWFFLYLWIW